MSFDQFVEAYLAKERPPYARIGRRSDFTTNQAGKLIVDHLFPYENPPCALQFLEQKLKRKITLKPVNASPKKICPSRLKAQQKQPPPSRSRRRPGSCDRSLFIKHRYGEIDKGGQTRHVCASSCHAGDRKRLAGEKMRQGLHI